MELGPYLHLQLTQMLDVWPLRSPGRSVPSLAFPADCPHPSHFHCASRRDASSAGSTEFPAYSRVHASRCRLAGLRSSNLRTVHCCCSMISHRARSFLPRSACCHADRTVSSVPRLPERSGVQSLRILEPWCLFEPFLLIARPREIFTAAEFAASTLASTGCPSI